jgi:hypothetical protein
MKTYPKPENFSGSKFAARYGLDPLKPDFYDDGQGNLVVLVTLPDDPPIFEAPDPPQSQGTLAWVDGPTPNTVRLVAKFGGKTSSIVIAGQDTTNYTMFVSPGPQGGGVGRKEFHVPTKAQLPSLQPTPIAGDTLFVPDFGEYRRVNNNWARLLPGPFIDSPADTANVYTALFAAIEAAVNPPQGPQIDPRVKAVLVELKKVLGG